MRKFIIGLLLALIIQAGAPSFVFAAKAPKIKHKIEFTTKDKYILVGDLYLANPKTNKPLVILLHSFSLNAFAWSDLAHKLRLKGYNVLAMDLRGHGRSVYNENLKLKSRYKFTKEDWAKLPGDVVESVAYVKSNYPGVNCNEVIIAGADIGASAGVLAGQLLKKHPQKIIMVSPMLNFKGLYIPIKVANYTDTRFLVFLSKSDKILFNFHTKEKPIIKQYPLGGPGNQLLKVNPSSYDEIVKFITTP